MRFRFGNLSLRHKIPLRATVLVFITATVLTASSLYREYGQMRSDLLDSATRWSGVLGRTLVAPMRHDDVWRAYEIIRAATGKPGSVDQASAITLVDAERRVYVSTDPERYPILAPLHELDDQVKELDADLQSDKSSARTLETGGGRIFVLTPIEADGVRLGHLLFEYSTSIFASRFTGIWYSASLVTLLVVAFIVPVSWFWGQRMAIPLVRLADCMGRIGATIPDMEECQIQSTGDEIGQVGVALRRLLVELREKHALEQQMMFSERLAAVGRLAGGIAHEINNPLGGMLNAINTYQRHGQGDPAMTAKTMSLLERGLLQIKETVSALLVEAKAPSHPLNAHDIEDVQTLIRPDAEKRSVTLCWECDWTGEVRLPSTLVRQVLINLLLNALHAVDRGGQVICATRVLPDHLELTVCNDGDYIGPERMPYLFEPFIGRNAGGHGLGLWITYQIVSELNGDITANSEPGQTRFIVRLPFVERRLQEAA
jgi:signal transduction histidine kinase